MLQRRRGSTPAAFVFSRSAVFADEVAEVTVDLRGFLDAGVEHGAPLPSIVVKVECSKEITGLKDDLESVARSWERRRISWACSMGIGGVPVESVMRMRILNVLLAEKFGCLIGVKRAGWRVWPGKP